MLGLQCFTLHVCRSLFLRGHLQSLLFELYNPTVMFVSTKVTNAIPCQDVRVAHYYFRSRDHWPDDDVIVRTEKAEVVRCWRHHCARVDGDAVGEWDERRFRYRALATSAIDRCAAVHNLTPENGQIDNVEYYLTVEEVPWHRRKQQIL